MLSRLSESDLTAMHEINAENIPAVGEETLQSLQSILNVSELAVGEFERDLLVGFALVLPPGTDYESPNYRYFCDRFDNFAYLDRVAFRASHRGRGLGASMYQELEELLDRPMLALEVNVVPPNEGSMRFHLRRGFVELEQLETRPGKVVSLMAKPLG